MFVTVLFIRSLHRFDSMRLCFSRSLREMDGWWQFCSHVLIFTVGKTALWQPNVRVKASVANPSFLRYLKVL